MVVEGGEGGGFKSPTPVSTMVLLPLIRSKVDVPIIAAGGIIDGATMAAAFTLGAEGVQMGTRMVSAAESPVHDNWKQAIVDAKETDTMYVMRSLRNTERVLRNEIAEKVVEMEAKGAGIAELAPLITGKNGLRVLKDGDIDVGLMTAGQSVGLVRDVPTVRELIDTIISEAQEIAGTRIAGMMS